MNITDYESLLKAAQKQVEPQRLLFVFLKASLPKDYNEQEKSDFHAGQGGALQAVMCVDKALEELGSFSDLVKESEKTEQEWQIVLVAGLSGINNVAPDSAEVERSLKMMVDTVQNGGDLSRFMAFNKGGEPVQFS
ncbi:MAG: ribonucleotide reductase subunit alpha [Gammaproteobacteria bacterium]|nr:ribonucleotide reductase subunit alpha [Gammaproteobacteria bacterium]